MNYKYEIDTDCKTSYWKLDMYRLSGFNFREAVETEGHVWDDLHVHLLELSVMYPHTEFTLKCTHLKEPISYSQSFKDGEYGEVLDTRYDISWLDQVEILRADEALALHKMGVEVFWSPKKGRIELTDIVHDCRLLNSPKFKDKCGSAIERVITRDDTFTFLLK